MSIRGKSLVILTTALLIATVSPSLSQAEAIQWRTNVDAAKIEAIQAGKLVLLHFSSPECGPCQTLDRDVFSQPQLGNFLEQRFVPVKVNAELSPALASSYGIDRVPMDIVLTPQGNVVASLSCPLEPTAYANQLGNVASHYTQFMAKSTAPVQPPMQSAYAGLQVGQYNAQPATATIANPQTVTPTAAYTTNPFAASPQQQPQLPPQQPQQAMQAAAQAPTSPVQSTPQGSNNPYLSASHIAQTSQTAQHPAPQAQATATTKPAPQLPPGSPPLAFDGYCPVMLKSSRKWVSGNPVYGAIHRGRTYLFTGESQRQQFLASPDAYSPVFSGLDAVLMLDKNQAVEGSRKYGYEYRGAFYLFHSPETMAKFSNDPDRYSAQVRQAMNRLDGKLGGTIRR